jgi:hypothetical protein
MAALAQEAPATHLELRPITLRAARAFVAQHHRHNVPPRGWLFGVGLHREEELVAVGIAGRPLARALDDGRTLEVLRCCTLGDRNAASRTYGALCRAGAALGYTLAVTYTLESEPGASLRAAGFTVQEFLPPRSSSRWASGGRGRYDETLWGEATLPDERRVRWARPL